MSLSVDNGGNKTPPPSPPSSPPPSSPPSQTRPPNAPMKKKPVTKNLQTAIKPLQTYVEINLPEMCRFERRSDVFDAQIVEFYSVYSDNIGKIITKMQKDIKIFTGIKIEQLIDELDENIYHIEKRLIRLHFMNENDKNKKIEKSRNICFNYEKDKLLRKMQDEECHLLRQCPKN